MFFGSVGMVNNFTPAVIAFEHSYCYNNIINLLLLVDTFAYSASFATEWQNGFFQSIIIRSNPTVYSLSKCVSTAIASGLSIVIGVVLFIIYICISLPTIMPDAYTINTEVAALKDLLFIGNPILYFLGYLYVIFLQAAFFGVLALLVSGYFPNKYVAYATSFTLGTAINQLDNKLGVPNWMDPIKLALVRVYGISPSKVFFIETVTFMVLTAICSVLFVRIVKRRIENG